MMPRLSRTNRTSPVDMSNVQLVLFAGGAGKRLGHGVVKPLLAPCGIPLIDLQIGYALAVGFRRITILTGYGADEVERHVLRAWSEYSDHFVFLRHEWNPYTRPYGTGRALLHAMREGVVDRERAVLTLFVDDLYARVRYVHDVVKTYYRALSRGNVLAVVLTHPGIHLPYGVVNEGRGVFTEKPFLSLHISTGMYLLTPLALRLLQETITEELYYGAQEELSFEKCVLESWSRRYPVLRVDVVRGEWLPVNDWKAVEQVCRFLRVCDWVSEWLPARSQ